MSTLSLEELQAQIDEYDSQIEQINELLSEEPDNEEYKTLKNEILQLIKEIKDIISKREQSTTQENSQNNEKNVQENKVRSDASKRAVELGLFVGLKVKAIWPEDKKFYDAVIDGIYDDGVVVKYENYGTTEKIQPEDIKISEQIRNNNKKRKEPTTSSSIVLDRIPKHLRPLSTDDEKTRLAKKKKRKALKLKAKIEKSESDSNQAKLAWHNFNKEISKKKTFTRKIKVEKK